MSFFDVTPLGRILARFSSDMNAVDTRLVWLLAESTPVALRVRSFVLSLTSTDFHLFTANWAALHGFGAASAVEMLGAVLVFYTLYTLKPLLFVWILGSYITLPIRFLQGLREDSLKIFLGINAGLSVYGLCL